MLHFLCSCLYLFTFLLSSQFYWHIYLKSTVYFFDPLRISNCTATIGMRKQPICCIVQLLQTILSAIFVKLCSRPNWQVCTWHGASRGPSATAELLVGACSTWQLADVNKLRCTSASVSTQSCGTCKIELLNSIWQQVRLGDVVPRSSTDCFGHFRERERQ